MKRMITCQFEDGGQANLRHCTVDVLLLQDQKILLCKRSPHLSEAGKWCLTGGYLDRDETIAEGAAREVMEESGWQMSDLTFLTIRDNPGRLRDNNRQNITFVLFATATEQTGEADDESVERRWFSFDDLPPRDQIAFDHADNIDLYRRYLQDSLRLPVLTTSAA